MKMNYILTWRGCGQFNGVMFSRHFERLAEMRQFARGAISNGCIVQHYSFVSYNGSTVKRPVTDLRNYDNR